MVPPEIPMSASNGATSEKDAAEPVQIPKVPPLNYLEPGAEQQPRRWWLPVVLLFGASLFWDMPRGTPSSFPDHNDKLLLGAMFLGSFLIGCLCSLPKWVRSAFGAATVCLFLLANLNDNNFRANIYLGDVLLPWSLYVFAGGVLSSLLAAMGSRASKLNLRAS